MGVIKFRDKILAHFISETYKFYDFLNRGKTPKCKIYVVHFCIVNGRLVLSTRLGIFNLVSYVI